jgi:hypothetical protein
MAARRQSARARRRRVVRVTAAVLLAPIRWVRFERDLALRMSGRR